MFAGIGFWFKTAFVGLWPEVWHFGLAGVVIGCALVLYFLWPAFLPQTLKKWALAVAVGMGLLTVGYTTGIVNENSRCTARENAAVQLGLAIGDKAHEDAVATINALNQQAARPAAPGVKHKWVRAPRRDAYDRDQSKKHP